MPIAERLQVGEFLELLPVAPMGFDVVDLGGGNHATFGTAHPAERGRAQHAGTQPPDGMAPLRDPIPVVPHRAQLAALLAALPVVREAGAEDLAPGRRTRGQRRVRHDLPCH